MSTPRRRFRTESSVYAIAFVFLLLIAMWVISFGLEGTLDIPGFDETSYLLKGTQIATPVGELSAEDGPLYSFWYRFMASVKPDPLDLVFFNMKILSILLPLIFL